MACAVFAQRHAGLQADLLKRPVALIAEQKVAHGIVGHKDVGESVAVEIGERDPHAFADVASRSPTLCETSVKVPSRLL